MSSIAWWNRVFVMPTLLTGFRHYGPNIEPEFTSLRASTRTGGWEAVAWPSMRLPDEGYGTVVCEATFFDARDDLARDPLTLVHWEPLPNEALFDLIPENRCSIDGTVEQTCELMKSLQSDPLRALMASVLLMPDVEIGYWTHPASLSHHHAHSGGLAQHSLEVAVACENVRGLDAWQRDLVIAYAFLHDLGKLWCYADGALTSEARRIGHEAIGYQSLKPKLKRLRESDERSGATLEALLSGAWKRTCKHPAAALGDIVRAMDRFSAAKSVGNAARPSPSPPVMTTQSD